MSFTTPDDVYVCLNAVTHDEKVLNHLLAEKQKKKTALMQENKNLKEQVASLEQKGNAPENSMQVEQPQPKLQVQQRQPKQQESTKALQKKQRAERVATNDKKKNKRNKHEELEDSSAKAKQRKTDLPPKNRSKEPEAQVSRIDPEAKIIIQDVRHEANQEEVELAQQLSEEIVFWNLAEDPNFTVDNMHKFRTTSGAWAYLYVLLADPSTREILPSMIHDNDADQARVEQVLLNIGGQFGLDIPKNPEKSVSADNIKAWATLKACILSEVQFVMNYEGAAKFLSKLFYKESIGNTEATIRNLLFDFLRFHAKCLRTETPEVPGLRLSKCAEILLERPESEYQASCAIPKYKNWIQNVLNRKPEELLEDTRCLLELDPVLSPELAGTALAMMVIWDGQNNNLKGHTRRKFEEDCKRYITDTCFPAAKRIYNLVVGFERLGKYLSSREYQDFEAVIETFTGRLQGLHDITLPTTEQVYACSPFNPTFCNTNGCINIRVEDIMDKEKTERMVYNMGPEGHIRHYLKKQAKRLAESIENKNVQAGTHNIYSDFLMRLDNPLDGLYTYKPILTSLSKEEEKNYKIRSKQLEEIVYHIIEDGQKGENGKMKKDNTFYHKGPKQEEDHEMDNDNDDMDQDEEDD